MKFWNFATALAIMFSSTLILAQEKHFTLKNTHIFEIENELTGRNHEIIVTLPGSYKDSVNKHYPVLYYVDAYWDTPLLNSIHGNLVYDNVIPELIMIGFSYPGEDANYGELRSKDLPPTLSGEADKFLEFIEKVIIPKIDGEYRTDKNNRAVSGNSLGGLFTLYAMYKKQNLFNRFISISPAVMWDNNYLFNTDNKYAEQTEILKGRLFLSYGGDEYLPFRNPIIEFQKQIAAKNYNGLDLLNFNIEGERHTGVKAEGYSRGLRWVFKDIAPTGPSGLAKEMNGH